jgi:DnaD/phage-associated family protein
MNTAIITINEADMRKLLLAASPDAALLYLYVHSGNDPKLAEQELKLTATRIACAGATLRQLGLWPEEKKEFIRSGQRPEYTENDVLDAMDRDSGFRMLYGEVQRLLGRAMNTEELKILLSFERYLGLPSEVISVLVSYCKDKARQRGSLRNPSLRAIEKEAYYWAEQGIDTLEAAAVFIQSQNTKNTRLEHLKGLLQIRGRSLTQAEEKYASGWVEMGFDDEAIKLAYERTCLNTGGLSWPYMNKILNRWHDAGMTTGEKVRAGDRKPVPQGASGQLGAAELEAIQRLLKEDT